MDEKNIEYTEWLFNSEEVSNSLNAKSDLEAIIRGHHYLENILTRLLGHALPHPELIDLERFAFTVKVDLCAAMGLIDHRIIAATQKANDLRNKVAHKLDYRITDQQRKDFFHSFPAFGRTLICENGVENGKFPMEDVPLSHYLKVLIVLIDLGRQDYIKWARRRAKAVEDARKWIEDGKATDTSDPQK